MPCPNCGGEDIAHIYYGGNRGAWRCLSGCPWTTEQGDKKCVVCGQPNAYLCDYPVDGGTCDAPMCWRHTFRPDPDKHIDYCPEHRGESDEGK